MRDSIDAILSLQSRNEPMSSLKWGEAFAAFSQDLSAVTMIVPLCSREAKISVCKAALQQMLTPNSVNATSALGAIRILLRERQGGEVLLLEKSLNAYLWAAENHESCEAGIACLLNALIHDDCPGRGALLQGGGVERLLAIMAGSHPAADLHLVARALYRLSAGKGGPERLMKARSLDVILPTLAWCFRADPPRFPLGAGRMPLASVLLKILYLQGASSTVNMEEGLGGEQGKEQMTFLGQMLRDALFLSNEDLPSYDAKLQVVNLLTLMPPTYASFLAEAGAIPPLVRVLELQLWRNSFGGNGSTAELLAPVLAAVVAVAQAGDLPCTIVKELVFPPGSDITLVTEGVAAVSIENPEVVDANDRAAQEKRMRPADAPYGTLRHLLINALTLPEPISKRMAGELLWALCGGEKEFIRRCGFGAGIGMLRVRGLIDGVV